MPKRLMYLVRVGINYVAPDKTDRRAEPGDVVDDLSITDAAWMLADGIIERVSQSAPDTSVDAPGFLLPQGELTDPLPRSREG